jgi:hypothetical protein
MSVCVYSVFVLGSGLATGWALVKGALPNVLDGETEVKRSECSKGEQQEKINQPTNLSQYTNAKIYVVVFYICAKLGVSP